MLVNWIMPFKGIRWGKVAPGLLGWRDVPLWPSKLGYSVQHHA